jgi:flagellar biosynthesis/type III secretory pathway protein FliH
MILSKTDFSAKPGTEMDKPSDTAQAESSVSWRLNELLKAGEKARAFASAGWFKRDSEHSDEGFTPWAPEVLGAEIELDAELVSEEIADQLPEVEIPEATEAEPEASEQEMQQPPPVIDPEELERVRGDSFDQGYATAMAEAEEKWRDARNDFVALTDSLRRAQTQTDSFYQPLKKLALHIAEQLVRGELTLSTAAVERLVDAAIRDIEQQGEGPIVVSLSAADHQQFTRHLSSDMEQINLRIDPSLSRGSVRVMMDDSAVEDLIETRLAAISDNLFDRRGANSATSSAAVAESADTDAQQAAESEAIIEGDAEELKVNEPRNSDLEQAQSPVESDESDDA